MPIAPPFNVIIQRRNGNTTRRKGRRWKTVCQLNQIKLKLHDKQQTMSEAGLNYLFTTIEPENNNQSDSRQKLTEKGWKFATATIHYQFRQRDNFSLCFFYEDSALDVSCAECESSSLDKCLLLGRVKFSGRQSFFTCFYRIKTQRHLCSSENGTATFVPTQTNNRWVSKWAAKRHWKTSWRVSFIFMRIDDNYWRPSMLQVGLRKEQCKLVEDPSWWVANQLAI